MTTEMATSSDRSVPIRTCVGCRARRPQHDLLRCVLSADGSVLVSRTASGRGAWICGVDCLAAAQRTRGFERAWRRPVPGPAIAELKERLTAETN